MGARAIDCPANGGLGLIPLDHCHSFTALGIQTERTEQAGGPRPDGCYAAVLSALDSDSEEEVGYCGAAVRASTAESAGGLPLLYEGDPITLSNGEARRFGERGEPGRRSRRIVRPALRRQPR